MHRYEPLSALNGSFSPDVVALAAELRLALGLGAPHDAELLAAYTSDEGGAAPATRAAADLPADAASDSSAAALIPSARTQQQQAQAQQQRQQQEQQEQQQQQQQQQHDTAPLAEAMADVEIRRI